MTGAKSPAGAKGAPGPINPIKPASNDKQRRSLSTVKAPGRVDRGGDPALADALVAALTEPQAEDEITESVTHPVHTYPARMHPATARALIHVVVGEDLDDEQPPTLLDPFCGSGTTLVEGRYAGARVIGVDANPLAVLIARAKTWTAPRNRREELRELGHRIAAAALAEGKAARRAGYEPREHRVPKGIDPMERDQRLLSWFAPHVRRELEHMAELIDDSRAIDREIADVLLVVLSSILYKVSRRASDTDPSRVERRIGRGAAARLFHERIEMLVTGLEELARVARAPAGVVKLGDARALDKAGIGDGSVDGIVTSPPYAGTYDYAEQHALRLDFLGMRADRFSDAELGSRRQFLPEGEARRRARRRYVRAMEQSLAEMARVLMPGGRAAIMLGDSVAGDRAMWADEVLATAMPESLEVRAWAWQERAKLGAREREAFAERPKREHIFLLERRQ